MLPWADRILFNLDYICWSLARTLGLCIDSYCQLETADSKFSLVANDGSLVSMLRIHGTRQMIGEQEFSRISTRLAEILGAYLSASSHIIQFVFVRNPQIQHVRAEIQQAFAGSFATMQRLKLELRELYQHKIDRLAAEYCSQEELFIALWTTPACLTESARRQHRKTRNQQAATLPRAVFSQDLRATADTLRDIHHSFVQALSQDLQQIGVETEILNTHAALAGSRRLLCPQATSTHWRACLPGDPLPLQAADNSYQDDLSTLLYPTIARQLFPEETVMVDSRTLRTGGRHYVCMSMELGPRSLLPFSAFFRKLLPDRIPWLLSLRLLAEGGNTLRRKLVLANLLSFLRSARIIRQSLENLQEEMEQGSVCTGLQMQFCTWTEAEQPDSLGEHAARLMRAVQSWGGIEVRCSEGNPAAAFAAAMPLLRARSPAHMSIAPLTDSVCMLPLTRPASPWQHGSFLFRTVDGKLYPYEPFSSLQKAWITLIFAPMGSGKSVLLNSLNTALVLAAGNRVLPRIGILDIGMSSMGMISLIRESLPPQRRQEVLGIRLQNTPDFTINPFDTLLGCRFPTANQRAFLANFLSLLLTPIGARQPHEGVSDLALMAIDEVYKGLADDRSPKLYQRGVASAVDSTLQEQMWRGDAQSTWWEVVDFLFAREQYHAAALAQRYAVPHLAEVAAIARSETISSFYSGTIPMSQERMVDYFHRVISDAIRKYVVLGGASRFTTDAQIISLDLEEVAPHGGADAERQTAVMYMLGRHVICADMYLRSEHLRYIAEPYRAWHQQRIAATMNAAKRICFDEFHRTEAVESVRRQVLLDIREGRKWKVEIILASQRLQDFDQTMIDLATTVFILGSGTQSLEQTVATFHLPAAAQQILAGLSNPGKAGASLLAWFDTAAGKFIHPLVNTLTAEEIWAYSTTREDISVRDHLYARLPPARARKILAKCYPAGSIKPEYERRLAQMREQEENAGAAAEVDLITQIAAEVLASADSR